MAESDITSETDEGIEAASGDPRGDGGHGGGKEGSADGTGDDRTDGDAVDIADSPTVAVDLDGERVTLSLPPDADREEAAAIVSAVGAHLQDVAVAAAARAGADDGPDRVDEWKLAGRMKAVGRSQWPEDVREGEEWKAAARSFY